MRDFLAVVGEKRNIADFAQPPAGQNTGIGKMSERVVRRVAMPHVRLIGYVESGSWRYRLEKGGTTMKRLLMMALVLMAFGMGRGQPEGYGLTLIMPDGTPSPFTVEMDDGDPQVTSWLPESWTRPGTVSALVGGGLQTIPIEALVRADLAEPGTETTWRFQTVDGRTLSSPPDLIIRVNGTNEFGAEEELRSRANIPREQPFIGIIFDEAAAAQAGASSSQPLARADADTVNLRNGDVLSGDILTTDFAVQASYGTLSFTKDQLASISIESQDGRTDQVVLDVGDRVSGVLQNESIEITLTSGATVTLEKGNIGSITFATE